MNNNRNNLNILKESRIAALSLLRFLNLPFHNSTVDDENIKSQLSHLEDLSLLEQKLITYNEFNEIDAYKNVLNKITTKNSKRSNYKIWLITSATVASILVIFFSLYPNNVPNNINIPNKPVAIYIPKSMAKAILSSSKGDENIINSEIKEIAISDIVVKNNSASSTISYANLKNNSTNYDKAKINRLSVPKGGFYQVILQDGTKVTLNSDSYLEYPTFFNEKRREVKLVGEAVFEVAQKKEHPFIIKLEKGNIKVLGTVFNVKSYPNEYISDITLLSGSVEISNDNYVTNLNPGENGVILSKNDIIKKSKANIEQNFAWVNNIFDYTDTPLELVINDIVRFYNVEILITTVALRNSLVTLRLSRSKSLESIIETLRLCGTIDIIQNEEGYILK